MYKMDLDKKLYTTRTIIGFLGGIISGLLKWGLPQIGFSIIVMGSVYILTILVAYRIYAKKGIYKLRPVFLEGIGGFIFTWLLIWAVLYNFLVIYS